MSTYEHEGASVRPSLQHGGLLNLLHLGFTAYRQRRHLQALDDRLLNDVGLSRERADAEARRPVWDVPRHWLR